MKESEAIKREGLFQGGDTTVTLTLDDGSELECVVLTIFEAGEDGRGYIAVMPESGDEEKADGQPELTNIETDEEYETVSDAFDVLLDEQEADELFSGTRE